MASVEPSSAPASVGRGARRSLAHDLKPCIDSNPCSPRILNTSRKQQQQLQLLQQLEQQQAAMAASLLNSRRYVVGGGPCSSSSSCSAASNAPSAARVRDSSAAAGADYCSSSSHGSSPVVAHRYSRRTVPRRMVVDEKQLAYRLIRARAAAVAATTAASCSSSSSSSSSSSCSSSDAPSLRCSIESMEALRRRGELARRGLLVDDKPRPQMPNPGTHRCLPTSTAVGSSGRNSDAEDRRPSCAEEEEEEPGCAEKSRLVNPSSQPQPQPQPQPLSKPQQASTQQALRLKAADMRVEMQEHAFRCARSVLQGMDKLQCKKVAWELKKEFDRAYGPAWHCIVGTSFGSYVTHSVGGFVYFSIGKVSVLLFQTAVELIDH